MAATTVPFRWTLDEFLRAWEAGVFDDRRAELIDGEVWAVPIGDWHGDTTGQVLRALPNGVHQISTSTLPTGESLVDPDCWVGRKDAAPTHRLTPRLPQWAPADVLLVVEVSDETLTHDLGRKAVLYAEAGYPHYWSVTQDGIYAHSDPGARGYRTRRLHGKGEQIPVPYAAETTLSVSDLIGTAPGSAADD